MSIYPKLILEALAEIRYPGEPQNIVESGMVEDDIRIDGNKVSFSLISPKKNSPFMKSSELIGLAKLISFFEAMLRFSSTAKGALVGSLSNFTPNFSLAGAKA